MMTAAEIVDRLALEPHPEGGFFRQTWIDDAAEGARAAGTCIYYLLRGEDQNRWHVVDATEIWHWHAGAPLVLSISETEAGPATEHMLTPDLTRGQPQIVVPKDHWQSARSLGDYTLVSCTVSPGFLYEGYVLAPPGFDIPRA